MWVYNTGTRRFFGGVRVSGERNFLPGEAFTWRGSGEPHDLHTAPDNQEVLQVYSPFRNQEASDAVILPRRRFMKAKRKKKPDVETGRGLFEGRKTTAHSAYGQHANGLPATAT